MKKIMLIVAVCLCLNLYAGDIFIDGGIFNTMPLEDNNLTILRLGYIETLEQIGVNANNNDGFIDISGYVSASGTTGINADGMLGDIRLFKHEEDIGLEINGFIEGWNAISASGMIGSIDIAYDTRVTGTNRGIYAYEMLGDIRNDGDISGNLGIYASGMQGTIYNYRNIFGKNTEFNVGIEASNMGGNIYNYSSGEIFGNASGINAGYMKGNIINSGLIAGIDGYAINAGTMSGYIENHSMILSANETAIYANGMIGNILNYANIQGHIDGIDAAYMQGNITNANSDSVIYSLTRDGIYAEGMKGDIINNGTISGHDHGIYTYLMIGNIYNHGTITSPEDDGIYAYGMIGNIYNRGTITGRKDDAIDASRMLGNVENALSGVISGGKYGIVATQMVGTINNFGTIHADFVSGINARKMEGTIKNWGSINSTEGIGIEAYAMKGLIINYGTIKGATKVATKGTIKKGATKVATKGGVSAGIYASSMIGSIVNHDAGTISGSDYGIYAFNMKGNITNHGTIEGDDRGIYAIGMEGNIINRGLISSTSHNAIDAEAMSGNIYNYGDIISDNSGISLAQFSGILYNYGLIQSGEGYRAIASNVDLTMIGNGTIIGEVANYAGDKSLNLINDTDTVLDLSQAPLSGWTEINLLQGEMILTNLGTDDTYTNIKHSADAYVHLSIQDYDVKYLLDGGILNPYDNAEGTPFGYVSVDRFYTDSGSTIEIDFGDELKSDFINTDDEGEVYDSTIKFISQYVFDAGWSDIYQIFSGIYVHQNVVLETSLFYTVQKAVIEGAPSDDYYVLISRKDETYSDHASYYNKGVAKFLDNNSAEETQDLQLALEQIGSANELNNLLEPYNMVGYASLANNNINWINNRTGNLFNMLGSNGGSETSTSNSPIGSSYATANTDLNRDLNGNNIWFDVYMSDNTLDGEAGYQLESDGYEVAFGIDREMSANMIVGISLNYNEFESDITGGLPVTVESEGIGVNAYGQYTMDQLTHKVVVGYTTYSNDATRAGAKADFDSDEIYAAYRAEYLIEKKDFNIIPLAGLQYSRITYDDIIEDGNNSGLKGYDYDSLQTELGVKLVKQLEALRVNAGLSWIHELLDTETDAKAVSNIGNYSQDGIERDEDTFRLSIGLDYQLSDKINLSLDYAKEFGNNTDSDSVSANIRFNF